VADYEINQNLKEEDKALIEKNRVNAIVRANPSFVSCQCGNIMEIVPGEVQRGLKDDKGQPVS